MATHILELLQLADSAFPSGSFAFSNGLESLAKLGFVRSMADFEQYLECHLEQIAGAEVPFLNSAHGAWSRDAGAEMERVAMEWDAWLFMPTQRRSSLAQGQAWSRVMEEAYPSADLRSMRAWFLLRELPLHFLMVFGASLKAAEKTLEDARTLFLHMAIRDQLGAAVRLGLLGSLQAQRLHRKFIGVAETFLARSRDWDYSQSTRTSPMIEIAQASHPYLYSKLFQS
jgi:urease accessory protein